LLPLQAPIRTIAHAANPDLFHSRVSRSPRDITSELEQCRGSYAAALAQRESARPRG
jgi:hypothetical protein